LSKFFFKLFYNSSFLPKYNAAIAAFAPEQQPGKKTGIRSRSRLMQIISCSERHLYFYISLFNSVHQNTQK